MTLLTLAPTGAETDPADCPALPVTLPALVADARAAEQLGAAVIHVHVRDGDGEPSLDPELLTSTVRALAERTDLVVQVSTGGAVTDPEEIRLAAVECGAEMASLTLGTVNFGDDVFLNRWPFVVELHRAMQRHGVVPEYEIFDLGHVATLHRLLDRHGPPAGGHVHCDVVLGVPGGLPATASALLAVVAQLPASATWSATGVGRGSMPVMLAALSAGGGLRVGLEDTLTLAPGVPVPDNASLVARAAELARLAQRPLAGPGQARAVFGLPARPGTGNDGDAGAVHAERSPAPLKV